MVIASHWPVPDDYDATERLISGLFAAPPGTGTAGALRAAQRALMDDPDTSHPYYWSGFAVVGDGAAPVVRDAARRAVRIALNLIENCSFVSRLNGHSRRAERGLLKKKRIIAALLAGRRSGAGRALMRRTAPAPPGKHEPIVSDSQFEEALPPLDPELNRPLEPIDPNAPPFPPVPGPVEDAPLGDPALTEPLPPLSEFDVQPVPGGRRGRGRKRRAGAGPLRARRHRHGRNRPHRPLPRSFRARGCGRRGGQRRDDRASRRGGRGARRPPAPLRRLL